MKAWKVCAALLKSAWLIFVVMLGAWISEQLVPVSPEPASRIFSGVLGWLIAVTVLYWLLKAAFEEGEDE